MRLASLASQGLIVAALAVACRSKDAETVQRLEAEGGIVLGYELLDADGHRVADASDRVAETIRDMRGWRNAVGLDDVSITLSSDGLMQVGFVGQDRKPDVESFQQAFGPARQLEFRVALKSDGSDDDLRDELSVSNEEQRLDALLVRPENLGGLPGAIDVSGLELRGLASSFRWYPYSDAQLAFRRTGTTDDSAATIDFAELIEEMPLSARDYVLLELEESASGVFTGADVESAGYASQADGPALRVTMRASRQGAFGDWTEANEGRLMAMVVDGRIVCEPAMVIGRIERDFAVSSGRPGGFTKPEMRTYLGVLRRGSLPLHPVLVSEESIER